VIASTNLKNNMTKKTRNWLIALSILAFPFVLFLGCLVFMEEPLPPVAPLPNPNGYEDLVKEGKMLAYNTGSYDWKNADEVRKVVSANAAALAIARTALSNQCHVPVQFTATFNSNHVSDVAWMKILGPQQAWFDSGDRTKKLEMAVNTG
jgi:hypothetical protein